MTVNLNAGTVILDFDGTESAHDQPSGDHPQDARDYVAVGRLEIRLGRVDIVAREVNARSARIAQSTAYDLLGRQNADPEEVVSLLSAAYAARYHWANADKRLEAARTDWMLARAHLWAGSSNLALEHARACHSTMDDLDAGAYDRASALEVLARALAASGSSAEAVRYIRAAREAGSRISSDDEKALFEEDFNSGDWFGLQ